VRNHAHGIARAVIDRHIAAKLGFFQVNRLLVDTLSEFNLRRQPGR
jgi:hypothetical protein